MNKKQKQNNRDVFNRLVIDIVLNISLVYTAINTQISLDCMYTRLWWCLPVCIPLQYQCCGVYQFVSPYSTSVVVSTSLYPPTVPVLSSV